MGAHKSQLKLMIRGQVKWS